MSWFLYTILYTYRWPPPPQAVYTEAALGQGCRRWESSASGPASSWCRRGWGSHTPGWGRSWPGAEDSPRRSDLAPVCRCGHRGATCRPLSRPRRCAEGRLWSGRWSSWRRVSSQSCPRTGWPSQRKYYNGIRYISTQWTISVELEIRIRYA